MASVAAADTINTINTTSADKWIQQPGVAPGHGEQSCRATELRIQLCNVCFPASLYCGGEEISGCYVVILTLA